MKPDTAPQTSITTSQHRIEPAGNKDRRPRVVIIGGGFAGLEAAKGLGKLPVDVTVVDHNNFHLFQPMLYQVATAGLASTAISAPIREVLHRQHNVEVMRAEVVDVDTQRQIVLLKHARPLHYDYLIVATGASTNYFGHPEWQTLAPSMKSLNDALKIRSMLLEAFEQAEFENNDEIRRKLLTFVLVGAGPTGVELAGSIAELTHKTLLRDFHNINPHQVRIVLVDALPRILPSFPEPLAQRAAKRLRQLGVEIRTGQQVTDVKDDGIVIGGEFFLTNHIIWTAGVLASKAGTWLGAETDKSGRVKVQPNLAIPAHANVFVIGDTACIMQDGKPLPGVAPVALQSGKYVARVIAQQLAGQTEPAPFHYTDKGTMAIVGRSFALVHSGPLQITGFLGWLMWVVLHILYLIGFRNRVAAILQYAWNYLTYQRSARIILVDNPRPLNTHEDT
ncbi:MAG TPA: NAD(P)/FAD-dependent oxidoreductase [Ktedonobacteraceae bacterium]|jgi:NADH dehydrogenase|nr:NAD(P)/FAD-dependent oxidoreductase [Ktedonobacteraceae bacterium]